MNHSRDQPDCAVGIQEQHLETTPRNTTTAHDDLCVKICCHPADAAAIVRAVQYWDLLVRTHPRARPGHCTLSSGSFSVHVLSAAKRLLLHRQPPDYCHPVFARASVQEFLSFCGRRAHPVGGGNRHDLLGIRVPLSVHLRHLVFSWPVSPDKPPCAGVELVCSNSRRRLHPLPHKAGKGIGLIPVCFTTSDLGGAPERNHEVAMSWPQRTALICPSCEIHIAIQIGNRSDEYRIAVVELLAKDPFGEEKLAMFRALYDNVRGQRQPLPD